ncbi:hypothetical protein KDL01_38930 [Actinospica durhamensis]|uniref:Uncharacterized protein n=1 Tax=Actinospica durhamensis TaxID=1508375 RepID=A0A941EYB0_9ACTN|nr:hypothetical protein [Actinospica durhamensis]MBR7839301.1 hypothetical protein [Actinospica durhamensis]
MFRPPQPIKASGQLGIPDQTDVFTFGRSGPLQVFWVHGLGRPWEGPAVISPNGRFPEGAEAAVSPQYGSPNQTDVFAVDDNGQLQVFWVNGSGPWNGPTAIGPAWRFPPGAPVAASVQHGVDNQTDVFAVDDDGQLQVFWVGGSGSWSGPVGIGQVGMFPPGASVAASAHYGVDNQTDVFAVDDSGQLQVFWVNGTGAWNGPVSIGRAVFPPGASVATSAHYGIDNRTDVFAVDNHGQLRVFWVIGTSPWSGPANIGEAMFPPGASVAASAQYGIDNQTDVFAVDNNGQLRAFWANGTGPWSGPVNIGPAGMFPRGASLATSAHYGAEDQTDVFAADNNGQLHMFWVKGAGPWSGPVRIGTPYSPSVRPAFIFAKDASGASDIEWHAFVNGRSAGTITHVWGLPPPLDTTCMQAVWAAPGPATPACGSPAAFLDGQGNVHVFFVSQADNRVWQIMGGDSRGSYNWFVGKFGNTNNRLPAPSSDPAALLTPDGTQHVFYCAAEGGLWHVWWDPFTRPNGGTGVFSDASWGDQQAFGAPAAFQDSAGDIHVLYRREGKIYQTIGQIERRTDGTTTYTNFRTWPFGDTPAAADGDIAAVTTSSGNQ